jgi:chromosome segregation ATPase
MAARGSLDKLAKQVALLERDQEVRPLEWHAPNCSPLYQHLALTSGVMLITPDTLPSLQEARIQAEKRLQQVEARQAEARRQLAALGAAADAVAANATAAVEELRQATKGMLGEVISRIADQFDALQAALEEAIGGRAAEAEARAAAAAAQQRALAEQRAWVEQQARELQQQLDEKLTAAGSKVAAAADEQRQVLESQLHEAVATQQQASAEVKADLEATHQRLLEIGQKQAAADDRLEQQERQLAEVAAAQEAATPALSDKLAAMQQGQKAQSAALEALQQRLASLAEQHTAAVAQQASGEGLLREALTVWQQGLEGQLSTLEGRLGGRQDAATAAQEALAAKLEEYKSYLKRLRRQVAEAGTQQGGWADQLCMPGGRAVQPAGRLAAPPAKVAGFACNGVLAVCRLRGVWNSAHT